MTQPLKVWSRGYNMTMSQTSKDRNSIAWSCYRAIKTLHFTLNIIYTAQLSVPLAS